MSIELVMLSNHLILCHPLLLLSVLPSIFSNELALCIKWPKYWSFSFSISPSSEYSGLISFRIDCFDLLACSPRDSQESSPAQQFESINSWMLSFFFRTSTSSVLVSREYHCSSCARNMYFPSASKWPTQVLQKIAGRKQHSSFHPLWSSDKFLQNMLACFLSPWKYGSSVLFISYSQVICFHLRYIKFYCSGVLHKTP